MQYIIAIYGAPFSSQSSQTALYFCREAIAKGHHISRVFFYQDAVHNASSLASPPQDETDIPAHWQSFIADNNIDGVVCIAAALRRGILNDEEQQRYVKPGSNLANSLNLSGLGQLIEGAVVSDRLVSFGA